MHTPLRLAFRRMKPNTRIVELICNKVNWLGHFCSNIIGCQVMVAIPHRRHKHGNQHVVRITLSLPRGGIVINREPTLDLTHQRLHAAIQDAFNVARRKLEDYVRHMRGK